MLVGLQFKSTQLQLRLSFLVLAHTSLHYCSIYLQIFPIPYDATRFEPQMSKKFQNSRSDKDYHKTGKMVAGDWASQHSKSQLHTSPVHVNDNQ